MDGGPIDWEVADGSLRMTRPRQNANHILSEARFQDADIHAEFMVDPRAKGNSGLYIHGLRRKNVRVLLAAADARARSLLGNVQATGAAARPAAR